MIHKQQLQTGRQICLLFKIWSTQVTIFNTTFNIITHTTVLYMIKNDVLLWINHTTVKITIHYSEVAWFSDIWFRMNKILFVTTATQTITWRLQGPPSSHILDLCIWKHAVILIQNYEMHFKWVTGLHGPSLKCLGGMWFYTNYLFMV